MPVLFPSFGRRQEESIQGELGTSVWKGSLKQLDGLFEKPRGGASRTWVFTPLSGAPEGMWPYFLAFVHKPFPLGGKFGPLAMEFLDQAQILPESFGCLSGLSLPSCAPQAGELIQLAVTRGRRECNLRGTRGLSMSLVAPSWDALVLLAFGVACARPPEPW